MLPGIRGLLHGYGVFPLHYETVEIFPQQNGDSFRHRPDDPSLGILDFVQNGQSPVLEDRVSI